MVLPVFQDVTEREVSEGSPCFGAFPADCPLVRQILTAIMFDGEY